MERKLCQINNTSCKSRVANSPLSIVEGPTNFPQGIDRCMIFLARVRVLDHVLPLEILDKSQIGLFRHRQYNKGQF